MLWEQVTISQRTGNTGRFIIESKVNYDGTLVNLQPPLMDIFSGRTIVSFYFNESDPIVLSDAGERGI